MDVVRDAFDRCLRAPNDASARDAFLSAHDQHQGAYVDAFTVGGITYPRTDGHRLNESQARSAISRYLQKGGAPADIKPGMMAVAYPRRSDAIRVEIEAAVAIAKRVNNLDWRSADLPETDAKELRELLRMPSEAGTYAELRTLASNGGKNGAPNPYRGYNADHLIPDKAIRGLSTVRHDSLTEAGGFATFLLDGQNKGSQHKYATDAQNAVTAEFKVMQRNPTMGEYLERVLKWMTNIYTMENLVVDGLVNNPRLNRKNEFQKFGVKGFALAQAGFMTKEERRNVGNAIATALVIQARKHCEAQGWTMDRELPLVHDLAVSPKNQKPPTAVGAV